VKALRRIVLACLVIMPSVGVAVTPEEIMVTTGGSEALVFAFMSCLNPGDQVIIPEPFYANYNGFAAWAGIEIVPVTASIENGFALPPMAAFEAAITDRTKGHIDLQSRKSYGHQIC
jgi:aspartate aminotransferase